MGVGLLDPAGRFRFVDDVLAGLLEAPGDRLVGHAPGEAVAALAETAGELLRQVHDGAGPVTADVQPAGGGRTTVIRHTWYPVREGGGDLTGVVVTAVAVPPGSATTAEGSARLELAMDAGGMGVWDWDLRSGRIIWDERTAEIIGIRLEDFDGTFEAFERRVHPDDVALVRTLVERAIAERGVLRLRYRIVRPDGAMRWLVARGRVTEDEQGQPVRMIGVAQDRTDEQNAADRVVRTLEVIHEAFYSLDRDWRFTYVNGAAEQLLGLPRDEVLGREIWDTFPDLWGSRIQHEYEEAMKTGSAAVFEERCPPGERWLEVRAYPDPAGLSVYFRDISKRRQDDAGREEQLRRQAAAHEAAQRLLDASALFRTDLSPRDAATIACQTGVEIFGCDRVAVYEIENDDNVLLAQHGGGELGLDTRFSIDDIPELRKAINSSTPLFLSEPQDLASGRERQIARRLGLRAVVMAPVVVGPTSTTVLSILGWKRHLAPPDQELLAVTYRFAQQVALTVEQARRREAEEQAAGLNQQLQASLLPSPSVTRRDLRFNSLYRPGERRMRLAGDFYDAVETPDGGLAMVIGDVTGHGPHAAGMGATLRAAWRALALQGTMPVDIVEALDDLLATERDSDEQLVTLCTGWVSPDRETATFVRAGHPPPIIVTPARTGFVGGDVGLLLGVNPETTWSAATFTLPPAWALLLYTDGLTDTRLAGSSERFDLVRLVDYLSAAGGPGELGDDILDRLHLHVRGLSGQPIEDDVALLLVSHHPRFT